MATRYWVGGTGTWDGSTTTNWSATSGGAGGASAPTTADTAIFDANSGTGTCTTAATAVCGPVTINTSTLNLALGANLTLSGALTLTAGTITLNNNVLTTSVFSSATTNTRTINFGSTGKIVLTGNNANIWVGPTTGHTNIGILGTSRVECTYSGATGTRTIRGGLITVQTDPINFYITAGTDTIATTGSNIFGTLDFTGFSGTLTNLTRYIYRDLVLSSGMTLTAGTAVTFLYGTAVTQKFTSNGKTCDFPVNVTAPNSIIAFQDAFTQGSTRSFTFTAGTIQFKNGVTSTVGSFVTSGTTVKYLQSTSAGSQATLSEASGTVDASYLTIRDINATGGATWNAYIDQFNIDAGNNDGWDFSISPVVEGVEYPFELRSFTEPRRF